MLTLLATMLPELARDETRTASLFPPGLAALPPDDYSFVEFICADPNCDCRRVVLQVVSRSKKRVLATINHSFDAPSPRDIVPEQTFLEPFGAQSPFADALLALFETKVLNEAYAARLVRHYEAVKHAARDPDHPIHERLARAEASRREPHAVSRSQGAFTPPPPRRGKKKWR